MIITKYQRSHCAIFSLLFGSYSVLTFPDTTGWSSACFDGQAGAASDVLFHSNRVGVPKMTTTGIQREDAEAKGHARRDKVRLEPPLGPVRRKIICERYAKQNVSSEAVQTTHSLRFLCPVLPLFSDTRARKDEMTKCDLRARAYDAELARTNVEILDDSTIANSCCPSFMRAKKIIQAHGS